MQSIVELAQRATGKTQMKSETECKVSRSKDFLFDLNDELELLNSTNSLKCEYRKIRRGERKEQIVQNHHRTIGEQQANRQKTKLIAEPLISTV